MIFVRRGPNWATCDDGFSVRVTERDTIEYIEGGHVAFIVREPGPPKEGIYARSLTTWEPPYQADLISVEKKREVVRRVFDALDFLSPGYTRIIQ